MFDLPNLSDNEAGNLLDALRIAAERYAEHAANMRKEVRTALRANNRSVADGLALHFDRRKAEAEKLMDRIIEAQFGPEEEDEKEESRCDCWHCRDQ